MKTTAPQRGISPRGAVAVPEAKPRPYQRRA